MNVNVLFYLCVMMLETIKKYIEQEQILQPETQILVAISGGADSVALLCALHCLGYACKGAHCNFQLRGAESERDEAFVRALCEKLDVPLYVTRFDTLEYAAEKKISVEMAARELRYNWFEQLRKQVGAEVIAVAHHKDDSIETFFINLLRGTGINGLCGIRPVRGNIVRPLLCVGREEILGYLKHIGQDYVTDSTNLEEEYVRNKIRLSVLPALERIQPQARQNIIATECFLRSVADYYQQAIAEEVSEVQSEGGIDIPRLLLTRNPELVLYEILSPLGFNGSQVHDVFRVLQGQTGKEFHAGQYRLVKDRTNLLIQPIGKGTLAMDELQLKTGENILPDGNRLVLRKVEQAQGYAVKREKIFACIDADKVKEPLIVRHPLQGDWFIPFGMKGKKLLSDFLTNLKYSRIRKEQVWLVCSGSQIVWVVGERPDNRFCLTPATQSLWEIELKLPETFV